MEENVQITFRISDKSKEYFRQNIKFKILVDDFLIGTIKKGDILVKTLEKGIHKIIIKYGLFKTYEKMIKLLDRDIILECNSSRITMVRNNDMVPKEELEAMDDITCNIIKKYRKYRESYERYKIKWNVPNNTEKVKFGFIDTDDTVDTEKMRYKKQEIERYHDEIFDMEKTIHWESKQYIWRDEELFYILPMEPNEPEYLGDKLNVRISRYAEKDRPELVKIPLKDIICYRLEENKDLHTKQVKIYIRYKENVIIDFPLELEGYEKLKAVLPEKEEL